MPFINLNCRDFSSACDKNYAQDGGIPNFSVRSEESLVCDTPTEGETAKLRASDSGI
jgi:hypothetical protein